MDLIVTLSINDTEHNDTHQKSKELNFIMLSVDYAKFCFAECHYAECCGSQ